MDPVKVALLGTHTMVSGADKPAVEAKVAELVSKGAKLVSKIESLGRNWVATLEDRTAAPDVDGCRVARLGLQVIVTGPDRVAVQKRAQQLMKEGAVLKSGPQENTNGWSAVLDEGGVDKTIYRW
jgi:predicted short-subunit dehydrogenase-like oxidoreductase (DUF2520 family)